MKKILFAVFVIVFANQMKAQQLNTFSLYLENKYSINPAVAGSMQYNPLVLSYRRLWTGIDNSPVTQYLSTNMALKENVGLGCKVYSASAGPLVKTGVEVTYAYHFSVGSRGSKLSFGISPMLYEYRLDKSKISLENPDDNTVLQSSDRLIVPDATFGAYYYNQKYYVGLAIPQLFNRKIDLMNKGELEERQVRHYFLNAGYLYKVDNYYTIEPSLLVKFIEAGIIQAEIGARVIYQKTFWGGVSYRTQDAAVILFGIRKDRFTCGYAYDITLSNLRKYSEGSHELLFIYNFNRSRPKLL